MLKAILLITVLLIILGWVSRPRIVINLGGNMGNQRNPEDDRRKWEQEAKRREGQIKVDYIPEKPKPNVGKDSDSGDYVDYEEVK
jgi:hypothetical protein